MVVSYNKGKGRSQNNRIGRRVVDGNVNSGSFVNVSRDTPYKSKGDVGFNNRALKRKESLRSNGTENVSLSSKDMIFGDTRRSTRNNAEMNPCGSRFSLLNDIYEETTKVVQKQSYDRALPKKSALTEITNTGEKIPFMGGWKKTSTSYPSQGREYEKGREVFRLKRTHP
ncbi:hypothetical protein ACOSQ4_004748 [Xanthoceras sorbifolium]